MIKGIAKGVQARKKKKSKSGPKCGRQAEEDHIKAKQKQIIKIN